MVYAYNIYEYVTLLRHNVNCCTSWSDFLCLKKMEFEWICIVFTKHRITSEVLLKGPTFFRERIC